MSIQLGKLVSQILHQYFGEFVQTVGADLYRYGSKPIYLIMKTTHLPKPTIVECLRALIKYGIVTFTPSVNEVSADYKLCYENVLLLLRYPRFLLQIKNKYGSEAEMIIEEILHEGTISASDLLINIFNKYKDDREKNISLVTLRDTLTSLVTAGYVQRAPFLVSDETNADVPTLTNVPPNQNTEKNISLVTLRDTLTSLVTAGYVQRAPFLVSDETNADVPTLTNVPPNQNTLPSVDIAAINQAIETNDSPTIKDEIYWKVNFDRFHQDFRDEIMIKAMSRRIDDNAGELMKHLLIQMYLRTDPWVPTSNPIPVVEIRESCKRANAEFPLLTQYLDQYLKVMEENSMGFVVRSGDAGGGQYSLNLRTASEQLLWSIVEHTIQEKLGSKAARIFRLIRTKKYIEEEDIQKNAMLPAKEAKQLTYKLMEEHFINLQPMRKAASSASGPSKAIYLYYIDLHQVAHMVSELTYVALYNCICRKDHERSTNRRIIDKQQRVETIVHGMRMRGEPEDNIKDIEDTVTPPEKNVLQRIQGMIKKLSTAEIQLDRTLFILQLYFIYNNKI